MDQRLAEMPSTIRLIGRNKLWRMTEEQRRRGPAATQVQHTGDHVRKNVERLRKANDWTMFDLAKRLKKAGRPIPQSGISRIESGERRVDVDDLTALAVVFGVSPAALLVPFTHLPTDPVEITGAGQVPAFAAWKWATGVIRRLRYDPDRRRQTQDMESVLYGLPGWLHPGKALSADVASELNLADDETLWLAWDEQGAPVLRKERDRG